MKLSDLKIGESAYILKVNGDEAFARRLSEIGFIRGEKIYNHMKAPLMDPVEYEIMGTTLTLRRSEAENIDISIEPVERQTCPSCFCNAVAEEGNVCEQTDIADANKENETDIENIEDTDDTPNFCKFCPEEKDCEKKKKLALSGIRLRKWNGQTIRVALVGNPNCGKTTLFNHISGGNEKEGNYCGVTVDIKEGVFIHNGVKVFLYDLPGTYSLASYSPEEKYVEDYLKNNKTDVIINVTDCNNLNRNLFLTLQIMKMNIPIVCALNMFDELEKRGDSINTEELSKRVGIKFFPTVSNYGKGLKILFDEVLKLKGTTPKYNKMIDAIDTNNAGESYAFINQILEGIYVRSKDGKSKVTSRIDSIVTNRWLGFIIFCFIIFLVFELTFKVGDYPMTWIDELFGWIGEKISESSMPDGWFKDLLVDGIIGGVGGVVVFLPNILILYVCISIMEDSGYMARAAFILDRVMRAFGLHGKSFIPMICGFGCNVPAIMSTRSIENRKNRLVTILVASLFSCSARLPVYNIISEAFFPKSKTYIILSLYVVGIILALILARIFSLFLVKEKELNYLMELPEYRLPSILSVLKHAWERGKQYLKKMGTVILAASIIIWVLSYFPHNVDENDEFKAEDSCLGHIGRFIEPVFKPMGFTWQMDVGLLAGLGAKEVVVSTLSILYGGAEEFEGEDDEEEARLISDFAEKVKADGVKRNSAYAYMLFTLLYFPCAATVTAIAHESSWKWSGFVVIYTLVLAWAASAIFYNIANLF